MIRPALAVMTSMSNCSTYLKGARYAVHQLEIQQQEPRRKVVVNVITTMQLQRKLDLSVESALIDSCAALAPRKTGTEDQWRFATN